MYKKGGRQILRQKHSGKARMGKKRTTVFKGRDTINQIKDKKGERGSVSKHGKCGEKKAISGKAKERGWPFSTQPEEKGGTASGATTGNKERKGVTGYRSKNQRGCR